MGALRFVVALSALLGSCAALGSEPYSFIPPSSSLLPEPHTAAELARFATYRGPGSSEQVEITRSLWRTRLPNGHTYFDDDAVMVGLHGHGLSWVRCSRPKYAGCLLAMIDRGEASGP